MTKPRFVVPENDKAAFVRDGAVCIRGLFSETELACVAQGIERNLNAPSASAKVASAADDPGFFFQDFCNWQRIPEYRDLIFQSAAGCESARALQQTCCRRR